MEQGPTIASGGIFIYRIYDVALEIDLRKVENSIGDSRRFRIERKMFSKAFEFKNPPVSLRLKNFETVIDGKPRMVEAYGKVYDYGVVSIIFSIPLNETGAGDLQRLAIFLRSNNPLMTEFSRELENLVSSIRDSMTGFSISSIIEDYTVYYIRKSRPEIAAMELIPLLDPGILMLHEEGHYPPGPGTVRDLLKNTFSYSEQDATVINWDNALVIDPSESLDIPDLLEFATAQLLELRLYDALMDNELNDIYERIRPGGRPPLMKSKRYQALAARLMRTVTDLTEITEKVDNSLKVTEDAFYARVYSAAVTLFRVKVWESNLRRKIDIASRVYDMLSRDISNRRTEVLEVIIVLLIAIEIVIFLFFK